MLMKQTDLTQKKLLLNEVNLSHQHSQLIVLLSNKLSFFLFSLIQCTIDSFYYVQDYDRNHPVGNEKDENNTI